MHDNRVGDGDAAGGDHQGSDEGEAEDDLVGKWRADALPPARGDAEGEERGWAYIEGRSRRGRSIMVQSRIIWGSEWIRLEV